MFNSRNIGKKKYSEIIWFHRNEIIEFNKHLKISFAPLQVKQCQSSKFNLTRTFLSFTKREGQRGMILIKERESVCCLGRSLLSQGKRL